MRTPQKLSPEEKKRLGNFMESVTKLSRKEKLSNGSAFLMKHQMRTIFKVLGSPNPTKIEMVHGFDVMRDLMPFKERRLRKLLDGRRS